MKKSKTMCSGCHSDFYNGHNPQGVKECWSYRRAEVVKRIQVGIMQNPPYEWRPQEVLNCYSPNRAVMLGRDDPRVIEPPKTQKDPAVPG